jgi:hypothetical protein
MFHKLRATFDPADILPYKAEEATRQRGSLRYYRPPVHPPVVRPLIEALQPDAVTIVDARNIGLVPHIDVNLVTNLNIYLLTGGGATRYWEPACEGDVFITARGNSVFREGRPGPAFVAQEGDAYLLDVSKFHSVDPEPGIARRSILQLLWRTTPFADVLARVQEFEMDAAVESYT